MSGRWSLRPIVSLGLVVLCLGAASTRTAYASTVVQLAWDANTEPDLSGYRILYGTTSGNYTATIDVGNLTAYAVNGLTANTTYYFTVVAYDLAGNVSGPSNEISATPTVLAASPTVTATDAPDPVAAGATLTYTLSYSNSGNVTATGVVISDTVPANTSFVSATAGGTLSGSVVTWSIGSLAAGASGSVQLVVRVASPLANGTLITHASYAIASNETGSVAGSGITTTVMSTPNTSACAESMTMNLANPGMLVPANATGATATPGVSSPSGC